jgi:hypothetical protein
MAAVTMIATAQMTAATLIPATHTVAVSRTAQVSIAHAIPRQILRFSGMTVALAAATNGVLAPVTELSLAEAARPSPFAKGLSETLRHCARFPWRGSVE